jgi:hypothetical protein
MSAARLLTRLSALGVDIRVARGGYLQVRHGGQLTDLLRDELLAHALEIVGSAIAEPAGGER